MFNAHTLSLKNNWFKCIVNINTDPFKIGMSDKKI